MLCDECSNGRAEAVVEGYKGPPRGVGQQPGVTECTQYLYLRVQITAVGRRGNETSAAATTAPDNDCRGRGDYLDGGNL